MRLSANVSDELAKRLYHEAIDANCSVSELVERALRRGFEEGWLPGDRCARRRRGGARGGAGAAP